VSETGGPEEPGLERAPIARRPAPHAPTDVLGRGRVGWRAAVVARARARTAPALAAVAWLQRMMVMVNRAVAVPCMVAMVVASGVLTYSVAARYFFKIPTDWQDETSVFLLVGATFLSAAYVQAQRGHVAIEILSSLLPPRANRVRLVLVDLVSLTFCAFFAWKSWTLLHEAWTEGQTSNSSFAPPMWIPYSLMAVGMTLLSLQLLVGLLARVGGLPERPPAPSAS
jgi:TRAP-type C4-dicarboxylate transport system permease small subunit